ncbi:hypothetical protein Tco_1232842, partial [Tanacetum coccineum]
TFRVYLRMKPALAGETLVKFDFLNDPSSSHHQTTNLTVMCSRKSNPWFDVLLKELTYAS